MDLKKLQKKVDKGLSVLSDHDDKKDQERYVNLRNKIEEVQSYIDNGVVSPDISHEMYNEVKKCIKEFEEDRFIFVIFLIILCGLLFVGVFYITYSHFHDYWHPHPGGHIKPPYSSKTTRPTSHKTSSTKKPSTKTTKRTTTGVIDNTTTKTTTTRVTESSKTTTSSSTTKPVEGDDEVSGFVTLSFDDSSLIDLDNLFPMTDSIGLTTKPTKWSLTSSLSNGSKDYILTYYIDFVDVLDEIPLDKRLDVNKLKYQILIKKDNQIIYDTQVQDMYDYPTAEEGIRPIISGQTMNNDQALDFELRMWLDSSVGNDQQGKKYKFKIDVNYTFEFID